MFYKLKIHKSQARDGFTLIALLLYISLAIMVLLAVSSFIFIIFQSQAKNQVISEIESQGRQAMTIITQAIRNAKAVNSPPRGASSSSLSINVSDTANNPTIFGLSANAIGVTEGGDLAISLTSSLISASNLVFKNASRAGAPEIINIQFTLSFNNLSNRKEYDYSKIFYNSASLR